MGRNTLRERSVLQILGFLSRQLIPTALRAVRSISSSPTSKSLLILMPLICTWIFIPTDFRFWSFMEVQECSQRKGNQGRVQTRVTSSLPPKCRCLCGKQVVKLFVGAELRKLGYSIPFYSFPCRAGRFTSKIRVPLDFTEEPNIFRYPRKEYCPLGWNKWLWSGNQGFGCLFPAVFMGWDNP